MDRRRFFRNLLGIAAAPLAVALGDDLESQLGAPLRNGGGLPDEQGWMSAWYMNTYGPSGSLDDSCRITAWQAWENA